MLEFASKYGGDNQGSQTWLDETRNSIGGSTVSKITGKTEYESGGYEGFVLSRLLEPKRDFNNIAMDFGSYFENVVRVYLSMLLKTEVIVLGAVPFLRDEQGRLNAHYSMDGMFEANAHCIKGVNGEDLFPDKVANYLLEIKSPWTRELKTYKRDGKYGNKGACIIPKDYIEQIKMGLVVIEPCECGFFMDCLARVCRLEDLCEDRKFEISNIHGKPRNTLTKVLASGVTKVYVNDITKTLFWGSDFYKIVPRTITNKEELRLSLNLEEKEYSPPFDFGFDPTKILRYLKEDEKKEHQFSTEHIVNMGLQEVIIEDEPNLLGYIPWKLFDVYYGKVEKEPDFMEPYKERIQKISTLFYECEGLSDDEIIAKLGTSVI